MKAAVCRAFGAPLSIEEIVLADPGPGEVAVRIEACAICHSDLIYADGGWGGVLPAIYGHEAAGRISAVGPGVDDIAVGQSVVVTMVRACGTCPCCAAGMQGTCEAPDTRGPAAPIVGTDGREIIQGLRTAAFAESAVVDRSQVVALPDTMSMDAASLLACGVLTGYGAVVNTARMPDGASVVVIGAGGVGLNAVQAAAIGGAAKVIAVDLSDTRLALSAAFGATDAVRGDQDPVGTVRTLTGGRGVDFVFVTVGAKVAIDQCAAYLAPGGTAVLVGLTASGVTSTFDPVALTSGSRRIVGSKMGGGDVQVMIPELVGLYQSGRLALDPLISGRHALVDINHAFAETRRGEGVRQMLMMG